MLLDEQSGERLIVALLWLCWTVMSTPGLWTLAVIGLLLVAPAAASLIELLRKSDDVTLAPPTQSPEQADIATEGEPELSGTIGGYRIIHRLGRGGVRGDPAARPRAAPP
mgnify:CR=1 FL=1